MGDQPHIADAGAATDTSGIVRTDVSDTSQVLATGGGKPPPAPQPPKLLPLFNNAKEAIAEANAILKLLGFGATKFYDFNDSQTQTPRPHIELKDCGFGAWTNSSKVIYLFSGGWDEIDNHQTGEEQRVQLWCTVVHESGHAKKFATAWKGSHPPTYSAGFDHETQNYAFTAKWLSTPSGHPKKFKDLLATSKAARDLAATLEGVQSGGSAAMAAEANGAPAGEPARNDYFFQKFCASDSVPKSLRSLSAPDALKQTYGY